MDKFEECSCGCGCEEEIEETCGCGCEGDCGDDIDSCGCGCEDQEHEHTMIVDLVDENGNTVPCEVVDSFLYNEQEYVLVQNPEDEAIYLFKVVGEGENGELVIPEDKEFEEVSAYYETLLEKED